MIPGRYCEEKLDANHLLGVKGLNIDDDDHDQNALVHFTTLCRETCIEPFSKFLRRNVADAPNLEMFGNKVAL